VHSDAAASCDAVGRSAVAGEPPSRPKLTAFDIMNAFMTGARKVRAGENACVGVCWGVRACGIGASCTPRRVETAQSETQKALGQVRNNFTHHSAAFEIKPLASGVVRSSSSLPGSRGRGATAPSGDTAAAVSSPAAAGAGSGSDSAAVAQVSRAQRDFATTPKARFTPKVVASPHRGGFSWGPEDSAPPVVDTSSEARAPVFSPLGTKIHHATDHYVRGARRGCRHRLCVRGCMCRRPCRLAS
jgi:hypothetical protein